MRGFRKNDLGNDSKLILKLTHKNDDFIAKCGNLDFFEISISRYWCL